MTECRAPESFDEARQRLSAFLRKNGYPESTLWVNEANLVWDKHRLWVREDSAALEQARQCYADGVKAGLGVKLHAFATADRATLCTVLLPTDDDAAQRALMPPCALKLSAVTNMRSARRTSSGLVWRLLSLLHRDSTRLFISSFLEIS